MEAAFEWDENKRLANINKHGIDFVDAIRIYRGFTTRKQDTRADYGEKRFIEVGLLDDIEIAVITTPRGDKTRIISARRARRAERIAYYEEAEKHGYRLREAKSNER